MPTTPYCSQCTDDPRRLGPILTTALVPGSEKLSKVAKALGIPLHLLFSLAAESSDLNHRPSVGRDAVHAMLGHLMDAFLLSEVPLDTDSERKRNSNPRKIYPADPTRARDRRI